MAHVLPARSRQPGSPEAPKIGAPLNRSGALRMRGGAGAASRCSQSLPTTPTAACRRRRCTQMRRMAPMAVCLGTYPMLTQTRQVACILHAALYCLHIYNCACRCGCSAMLIHVQPQGPRGHTYHSIQGLCNLIRLVADCMSNSLQFTYSEM